MGSHEQRVLAIVRQKLLNGDFAPGERISEVAIAEELGVSRTPARSALVALVAEGLLEKRAGRGYSARAIRTEDVADTVEVRAALEALAARHMARNGASGGALDKLNRAIEQTAMLLEPRDPPEDLMTRYQSANVLFHETIMNECGNEVIPYAFERIRHLPMAALGTLAFDPADLEHERMRLAVGHSQHVIIRDAIIKRDPARAEAMMREHSHATLNYGDLFVTGRPLEMRLV